MSISITLVGSLLYLLLCPLHALSQTCCERNVGIVVKNPPDVEQYPGIFFPEETGSGMDAVFTDRQQRGGPSLRCPRIEIKELHGPLSRFVNLDYQFAGTYSVKGTMEPPRGLTLKLAVDLVDVAHNATVKSAQKSWSCNPAKAGECAELRIRNTEALAKTFQPLDKIIYDYERIPETVTVKLEKEPILAGEEMKITLTNIKDVNARPSQPWQRILVKAEQGKILNGESYQDFKVFKVGGGTIDVAYRAPDACTSDIETITVMNSCSINPDLPPYPERQITEKRFDIFCVEGKIRIEEDWSSVPANPLNPRSGMSPPQCAYKEGPITKTPGWITFRLRPTKDACVYEIVEKENAPSLYEERLIPANTQKCCDYKYRSSKTYKLSSDGARKPIVNFRNNPARPFSVYVSNQQSYTAECLNAPSWSPMRKMDYSGDWDLHNNAWPLKNGFVEDIRSTKFELVIDDKEVEKLRDRCTKGK